MVDKNARAMGELKIGYSRGLPEYTAPRLFTNKKQEEFFVANIYTQMLFFSDIPVTGVYVCEDDSNMGADAIIKTTGGKEETIQITRFVLTNYLKRKNAAAKRVMRIVEGVLAFGKADVPVNIRVFPKLEKSKMPADNRKIDQFLAEKISMLIKKHSAALNTSHDFINCPILPNDPIFEVSPIISLQSIPPGCYSNYVGKDNIYISLDFNEIYFNQDDIRQECTNIFSRKNGGKSSTLLIWADRFEILYSPELIIHHLQETFKDSSFERVYFLSFFTKKHLFNHGRPQIATIKGDEDKFKEALSTEKADS